MQAVHLKNKLDRVLLKEGWIVLARGSNVGILMCIYWVQGSVKEGKKSLSLPPLLTENL